MALDCISIGNSQLHFIDAVRGLKSEADRVSQSCDAFNPEVIAMSIAREEVEGLREYVKDPFEIEMSRYEMLYARNLARYGDVFLPPPCFLAGIEEGQKRGIDVIGVDMDDDTHTTAYCSYITGFDLFRHTVRFNLLRLRSFKAEGAAAFAKEWDRKVNNLKGFRLLEKEREGHISREIRKLAGRYGRMILIVDAERASGVRELLLEKNL